jgi:UDP-N-acetylglucosamine 2-epimerase (non-hydrolysing)
MKIINICGARPNFMKIAPLMAAYQAYPQVQPMLVHTGQHYDEKMSDLFFRQLRIPAPDLNLEVGSASHAVQTARIMEKFEPIVLEHKPDYVLVVGDVNSTIACALVASKLGVRVIHVEAGLRSFDRTMPEEINRILTDSISDLLFVSERSGVENLRQEGVSEDRIFFVGNVMIDTLLSHIESARKMDVMSSYQLESRRFGLVTMHRPANVDDPDKFRSILQALGRISQTVPLLFAIHPRTRKNIETFGLSNILTQYPDIRLVEPFGYLEFLNLMSNAAVVLTDSGGMQEETTILGTPCLTLRENTERPATISHGTNRLVMPEGAAILKAWDELQNHPPCTRLKPDLWDGSAAGRIVKQIVEDFQKPKTKVQ